MVDRRQHPGLAFESGDAHGVAAEGLGQDFDRDLAAELRVARAIDFAHSTGPERTENLKSAEPGARFERHGICGHSTARKTEEGGSRPPGIYFEFRRRRPASPDLRFRV